MSNNIKLIDQLLFSFNRYFFWLTIPFFFSNNINFISDLIVLNLFILTIYSLSFAGPGYYYLSRVNKETLYRLYLSYQLFLAIFIILLGSIFSLIVFSDIDFVKVLLCWVLCCSDFNRKFLLRNGKENIVNITIYSIVNISLLCGYNYFELNLSNYICLYIIHNIFLSKTLFIINVYKSLFYINKAILSVAKWKGSQSFAVLAICSYLIGNFIFIINPEDIYLDFFVVIRNYFTPLLIFSLYLENYLPFSKNLFKINRKTVTLLVTFLILYTFILSAMLFKFNNSQFIEELILLSLLIASAIIIIKYFTIELRKKEQFAYLNNINIIATIFCCLSIYLILALNINIIYSIVVVFVTYLYILLMLAIKNNEKNSSLH